ncbi:hypothetical protein V5F34_08485 [Xanthobacter autotrophicus]|uniref:hypothetical protein n=1 Tax=Xanthobacter autotrophicus TaxID=280 RepID=UPI0037284C58
MERVVKNPFPWSANGISIEVLKPGDARDFGELTAGLDAAGFLESEGTLAPNSGGTAPGAGGEGATEVVIPEDWKSLHHATKKKLAREITGEDPADTAAAEAVIEAEIARRAAAAEAQA